MGRRRRQQGGGQGGRTRPAPPPADPTRDVAWLKVKAEKTFGIGGVFAGVTFIQRVLTYGGQPPQSCDSTTIGVPYTTLYIFWEAVAG